MDLGKVKYNIKNIKYWIVIVVEGIVVIDVFFFYMFSYCDVYVFYYICNVDFD